VGYALSMGFHRRLLLLACALALAPAPACDKSQGKTNKDEAETLTYVKLEAAKRALAEIHERKRKGKPIYADCTTAKMLFLAELKQAPQAAELTKQLLEACQDAKPNDIVEITP
jgi:hypothetical protein